MLELTSHSESSAAGDCSVRFGSSAFKICEHYALWVSLFTEWTKAQPSRGIECFGVGCEQYSAARACARNLVMLVERLRYLHQRLPGWA